MSGVKNFVSNTGALLRGDPFSQVKSPNANGVKLSTPSVASGARSASGIACVSGPASLSFRLSMNDGAGNLVLFVALAPGAGAAPNAGGTWGWGAPASDGETSVGTFITRSLRVALLATTVTAGATVSG